MYERERQGAVSEKQMMQVQLEEISTRNQELFNEVQERTEEADRTRREMQQMAKQFENSLLFRNEDARERQHGLVQEIRLEKEENDGLKGMIIELTAQL